MREYHPSLRHLATCSHVIGWVHGGNGHFLLTGVRMHVFPLLPKDSGPNFFFTSHTNPTAVVFYSPKAIPMIDKWLERGTRPTSHDEPF